MKLSILCLAPLAAALPGSQAPKNPNGPFTVTAARSASQIHFLPLTASGGHFWLGGKSQTYIPGAAPYTGKQTNDTILQGQHFLDVVVPGGQRIYIDPSGALSFTVPHSGFIAPGSSEGPFKYAPGNPLGTWSYKGHGASGFMACPVNQASSTSTPTPTLSAVRRQAASYVPRWQVFAALQNATVPSGNVRDCLGFDALAMPVNVTSDQLAWEYI
ncbi:hypothetical protein N7492_003349 [Penicillium capsulatum]|uniref:IgE-binding protein n=1 Tax=Penicillium capsulatum TaxID=69766 RepID=A0A9W9ILR1_9EURO|nr:hypothetical protein N7492_003349 [Penicillium capsulatum]KAJ6122066.1 hypothetical protein N7512_004531 [Penicillium capsulatum]